MFMQRKANKALIPFARSLRRAMTKEERHLWFDFLRAYPVRKKKKKILGKYIADFYCAKARLVIELDGAQLFEEENERADAARTTFLESYGILVVRITNLELVRNFQGVCMYIDSLVKERTT